MSRHAEIFATFLAACPPAAPPAPWGRLFRYPPDCRQLPPDAHALLTSLMAKYGVERLREAGIVARSPPEQPPTLSSQLCSPTTCLFPLRSRAGSACQQIIAKGRGLDPLGQGALLGTLRDAQQPTESKLRANSVFCATGMEDFVLLRAWRQAAILGNDLAQLQRGTFGGLSIHALG